VTYPYIQAIQFVSTNDDWIDVNLLGAYWQSPGSGMCIGFPNSGAPVSRSLFWDDAAKAYDGNGSYTPVYCSPLQTMRLFIDNRGGGPFSCYFYGPFSVYFATSATTGITHSYTPTGANYAGPVMLISSLRAAAGLNAIMREYSSSPIFASYVVS